MKGFFPASYPAGIEEDRRGGQAGRGPEAERSEVEDRSAKTDRRVASGWARAAPTPRLLHARSAGKVDMCRVLCRDRADCGRALTRTLASKVSLTMNFLPEALCRLHQ